MRVNLTQAVRGAINWGRLHRGSGVDANCRRGDRAARAGATLPAPTGVAPATPAAAVTTCIDRLGCRTAVAAIAAWLGTGLGLALAQ
eukprot:6920469-Alexandrium_andersonii.AAC.1